MNSYRSCETARTLLTIGLLVQVFEVLLLYAAALLLSPVPFSRWLVLLAAGLGTVWVLLVYLFAFVPAHRGQFNDARRPAFVFGVVSLLTGGLVSGVLYVIAGAKFRSGHHLADRTDGSEGIAASDGHRCVICGATEAPVAGLCPSCGVDAVRGPVRSFRARSFSSPVRRLGPRARRSLRGGLGGPG